MLSENERLYRAATGAQTALDIIFDASSLAYVACDFASFEHFFVVRWGDAQREDIEQIIAEVTTLREQVKRPIYYVGILPDEMPKISDTQRDDFMRLSETLLPHCEVFAVAMEAKGFRGAIQRSAMAAILLLTRKYRGLRFVDSIESALAVEPSALPASEGVCEAIERVGATAPAM